MDKQSETKKILVAGEGGQGIQTIAKLIAKAAYNAGKHSLYIPNFGVEQRGGVSIAFVQFGEIPIPAPKFKYAELAIILSDRAVERVRLHIGPKTEVIWDSSVMTDPGLSGTSAVYDVPANKISLEEFTSRSMNIVILGAATRLIPELPEAEIKKAMDEKFASKYEKKPELKDFNQQAFEKGEQLLKA